MQQTCSNCSHGPRDGEQPWTYGSLWFCRKWCLNEWHDRGI